MSKTKNPAFDRAAWREKITAVSGISPLKVNVPFWGECYVSALTAGQAAALAENTDEGKKLDEKYGNIRLIAAMVCDPDGVALFDKSSVKDLDFLQLQRAGVIGALMKAITRHNGWDAETVKNV
jgi:hypothetical protein